jgi:hypothetical protein
MKKTSTTPASNPWSEDTAAPTPTITDTAARFDLEGLMTDFPTARELEKFVYDQTGLSLNLKGRSNKFKYQVALDALEGRDIDPELLTQDNPYIDRNDLVPTDPIRERPESAPGIPRRDHLQNFFHMKLPHPDEELRNMNGMVSCCFRKYDSGLITYEILGPIQHRAEGEKIDKYGRTRPEVIRVIDPRTGEQIVRDTAGNYTQQGQRLRAVAQKNRMWEQWIDREFISVNEDAIANPWA